MRMIGHNSLTAVDPEKLLTVDPKEIASLLDIQYRDLCLRSEALVEGARWKNLQLEFQADMVAASNLYRELSAYGGSNGEVEAVRRRVKAGPLAAGRIIDKWFERLRLPVLQLMDQINAAQEAYAARQPGPLKIRSAMGTTTSTPVADYEIEEPAALPRDFLAPDHDKISAAIAEGKRDIPGVRIVTRYRIRRI